MVLKPRGMGASAGVIKVGQASEMAEAFTVAARASDACPPAFEEGLLVEELVEGPEISVDGVVAAGEYRPFCLPASALGPLRTSRRSGTSSMRRTRCWKMPGCTACWPRAIALWAWPTG